MAKKRRRQPVAELKLQITGGQANPAPPVGPALSQHGVNIGQFINQFNERTQDQMGVPIPVEIAIYRDGSFDFDLKKPPVSYMLKRAAAVAKGSGETGREYVGHVSDEQVREIAEEKMPDLNAHDMEGAIKIVEGTARSAGIEVVGPDEEPSEIATDEEEESEEEEETEEAEETV
jgi:large subunit ribosomal protein L11